MKQPSIAKNLRVMYVNTDYNKIELVVAADVDGHRRMLTLDMIPDDAGCCYTERVE